MGGNDQNRTVSAAQEPGRKGRQPAPAGCSAADHNAISVERSGRLKDCGGDGRAGNVDDGRHVANQLDDRLPQRVLPRLPSVFTAHAAVRVVRGVDRGCRVDDDEGVAVGVLSHRRGEGGARSVREVERHQGHTS